METCLRHLIILSVGVCYLSAYAAGLLSDPSLSTLASFTGQDLDPHTGRILAPILRPRVPGTPGSAAVREHFLTFFQAELPLWSVTLQNSTAVIPPPILDPARDVAVPIVNIIATREPPPAQLDQSSKQRQESILGAYAPRRLVLAAHYDSKYGAPPDAHTHRQNLSHGFIGATDSAVPCALILHVAKAIDGALTRRWTELQDAGLGTLGERGMQILLLDGEESFGLWSETDSLHGSRALAAEWGQPEDTNKGKPQTDGSRMRNALDRIDLLMLLDLLGSAGPRVPSFFQDTHWVYQKLARMETRLRDLGLLESQARQSTESGESRESAPGPTVSFFPDQGRRAQDKHPWQGGRLEDDHLPFWKRGVHVLHIISAPYPNVWHTMNDDAYHLDQKVTRDWGRLITALAADWLGLEGYI